MVDALDGVYHRHIEEGARDNEFVVLIRNRLVHKMDDVDRNHRKRDREQEEGIKPGTLRSFLFGSEEPDGVSDEKGSANEGDPSEPGDFCIAHADDTGESKSGEDGSDNREEDELAAIDKFCFGKVV